MMTNSTDEFWPAALDVEKVLEEKNRQSIELFLPAVVYTSVLMVLGIVGNGLTFLVYMKYIIRPSTKRLFILVLAICDFVSCSILLPALIAEIYFSYTFTAYQVCKAMRYLFYCVPFASVFTLLLISLERCRKICYPLKWQITLSLAKKLLFVLTIIFPAILSSPAAILSGSAAIKTGINNITGTECHTSDEFKHTPFPLMFSVFLLTTASLAALVLIAMYSLIWKTTWRHVRFNTVPKKNVSSRTSYQPEVFDTKDEDHIKDIKAKYVFTVSKKLSCPKRHGAREQNMKKVTHIMFVVTLVFIISFIPNCVLQILNAVIHDFFNTLNHPGKIVYQLMLRSFMISYSMNPVVYGLMDIAYRKACKNVFRCRHTERNN